MMRGRGERRVFTLSLTHLVILEPDSIRDIIDDDGSAL